MNQIHLAIKRSKFKLFSCVILIMQPLLPIYSAHMYREIRVFAVRLLESQSSYPTKAYEYASNSSLLVVQVK